MHPTGCPEPFLTQLATAAALDIGAGLQRAVETLGLAGVVFRHVAGVDMFLDGPDARPRDAVHVVFAEEKVRPEYPLPAPDVAEQDLIDNTRTLALDALVRMKLTSFRDRVRVHLRDMLEVGLLDATWLPRVPEVLRSRLQELLDTPEK